MKKNRSAIIILFAALALVLILYFIFYDEDKRFQWYENYRASSDQPYGTLFIKKMLEGYHADGKFLFNDRTPLKNLLDSTEIRESSSYVFVGQNLLLDSMDAKALVDYMDSGGDAFIATLEPPNDVLNSIYFRECDIPFAFSHTELDSVNLNFFHERLRTSNGYQYTYRYGSQDAPYTWGYLNDSLFCDSTQWIIPLGKLETGRVNFLRIAVGKGNLYLHSNPLVFTNYFLCKPDKVDYAEGVFSHLRGKNIIWDEYSKIYFNNNRNAYNSPLYFIMQQPSLKYAWWLLLIAVLLYIFFFSKRQQRIIPVLERKTNTSLEFVNLISTLHYRNGNHVDMARKKMKYFLYFVRSKYGINAERFNEDQIRQLAEKAKMNVSDVQTIFDQYNHIEKLQYSIEANRLLTLYHSIENFYSRCK